MLTFFFFFENFVQVNLLDTDDVTKQFDAINRNFKVLVSLFILVSFFFVCGFFITIVISSTALSKGPVKREPVPETTKKTSTTSTTTLQTKINSCANQQTRWFDIKQMQQSSFFPQYSLVYEKIIRAMVEICIPEIYYIVHFDDEIALIEDKSFKKINTFESKIGKYNIDKIRMVATKDKIILTDNTDYLHIYTLDVEFKKSKNINDGLSPIKIGAMFYDSYQNQLLRHRFS